MKKLFSILLAVCVVLSTLVFTVSAVESSDGIVVPITKAEDVDAYNNGTGNPENTGWYANSNCMIMRGYYQEDGRSWIEKTINVPAAGDYRVFVNYGTSETGFKIKVGVGENAIVQELVSTEKYTTFNEVSIGVLTLEAGEQTLFVGAGSNDKAAFVNRVRLVESNEDFENGYLYYDIDKDTITPINYTEKDYETGGDLSFGSLVNLRNNKHFTISVKTEKALSYKLNGILGTKSGSSLAVSVNGYKQFDKTFEARGDYSRGEYDIGVITLNRGENIIDFALTGYAGDAITMDVVEFNLVDSFQDGKFIAWTQDGRVPVYQLQQGFKGTKGDVNDAYAVVNAGNYLEFDVYTESEHTVIPFLWIGSPVNNNMSISINGVEQFRTDVNKPSSAYGTLVTDVSMQNAVTFPVGYSTVRFTLNNGGLHLRNIIFEEPKDEVYISDVAIENADGVRLPFVFRDGLEGYAAVNVRRYGDVSGRMRMMLATYENNRLVGVNMSIIDITDVADRTDKTFKVPLALTENCSVKAFLLDEETFKPLCEAATFTQMEKIFSDEKAEELKNAEVIQEPTTALLNNDGVNYADYSDGNIKSIFYSGYNGTKVFAYMGIPEGASADSPVPAMVLVHGGVGKAEKEWVRKWNNLGVAAIAMDLYGGGPEKYVEGTDDASLKLSNGMKRHPYAGRTPFEFNKNFETAGMYQTVVNIIYAHNLIRSQTGVDASRIGITGISWGGVSTTTTIGVDDRFLFAAPVYGCGYLDQSRTYFSSYFKDATASIAWDPANFASQAKMPVMYVNSDVDDHFSINITSNTASVTENGFISIMHGYGHSQGLGDSVQQVYDYGVAMFEGKDILIDINSCDIKNNVLTASFTAPTEVSAANATVYYISEGILPWNGSDVSDFTWKTVTGSVSDGVVTAELPGDATFAYLSITDNNGHIISSGYLKVK